MSLVKAFRDQSETCARMGSPLMGRVLNILADNWDHNSPLGHQLAAYTGDIGPAGHSLPLRVAGALHALVLENRDAALVAAYPPHDVDDATLEFAILNALKQNEEFVSRWVQSPPQTNEVRRSAVLIAMAHVALSYFDRPIVLSELGASGGLNLMWDQFALEVGADRLGSEDAVLTLSPDWTGPAPPKAYPQVVDRLGVDLNPLNPRDSSDLLKLTAYLWADQPHRLALTRAAVSALDAHVEKSDAINWLEHRLEAAPKGHMHIIQNTVAWQYFPAECQARGSAMIEAMGARATAETPLAWMQMETDGDTTGAIGAALTLRLWPGDISLSLGRADFHGRWVNWTGLPHRTSP